MSGKRENPASSDGKTSGGEREYIVGKGKGKYSYVDINSESSGYLSKVAEGIDWASLRVVYPWVRMNAWAGVDNFSTDFPHLSVRPFPSLPHTSHQLTSRHRNGSTESPHVPPPNEVSIFPRNRSTTQT